MTIGHSNRPLEQFIQLLEAHGVEVLADVRTVPRSRHNPQFNRETLPGVLAAANIEYRHMPGLGGLRHALKDSINRGWQNLSFRGFADYMQTGAFEASLDELLSVSRTRRVALMCAESVPWRCHRSLIADALVARGVPVRHIANAARANPHRPMPFARIESGRVTYPAP